MSVSLRSKSSPLAEGRGGKGPSHALLTAGLYSEHLPLLLEASYFPLFPSSVDIRVPFPSLKNKEPERFCSLVARFRSDREK